MSSTSKLVFGRLCQYAGEDGHCFPAYSTLAEEIGIKRRQAMRAVKELEVYGLIRPIGRFRPDGGSTTNIYVFLWHNVFDNKEETLGRGVKKDTGGSAHSVTPPECHKRHRGVSEKSPKEIKTKESIAKKTTTEQVRVSLTGTQFSEISDNSLKTLIKRHGIERVIQVSDMVAQTWRRNRKVIRNPGGYFQTLCESHVVPGWYESPEVRNASLEAERNQKRKAALKEEEIAAEKRDAKAREDFWCSLSDEERQKFREKAKESSPLFHGIVGGVPLDAIAKMIAWNTLDFAEYEKSN